MRGALLMALLLVGAGCGQTPEAPPPDSASPPSLESGEQLAVARSEPVENEMLLSGVNLWMHDYTPTAGQLRKPTIWVHAESGRLAEDSQLWSLQDTRAVIYRENDEDLTADAAQGAFDQTDETAVLTGDVTLLAGSLEVALEKLKWDNVAGVATSDRPVRVTSGEMWLTGEAMWIRPDENLLQIEGGSGAMPFAEVAP